MAWKWLAIPLLVLLLTAVAARVLAQDVDVPPPYTDLRNPFPWDDPAAQAAGKDIYSVQCLGCHGIKGEGLAVADFSALESRARLEEHADFSFWILSEGRIERGMPGYKASLSEQQRWQLLTYLWEMGGARPSNGAAPVESFSGTIEVTAPPQGKAGETMTIRAVLKDDRGQVVPGETVRFFFRVQFFADGFIEIGQAVTDPAGVATLEYVPRNSGDVPVVARFRSVEDASATMISGAEKPLYVSRVGFELPKLGSEVFVGPPDALHLPGEERAPNTALRLPGGVFSWLFLPVGAIALIWWSYFRVVYQLWRIPPARDMRDIADTRTIPRLATVFVLLVGTLLILMFLTGPYSHFHVGG